MSFLYIENNNNICDIMIYYTPKDAEPTLTKTFIKGKIKDYLPLILKNFTAEDDETGDISFSAYDKVYIKRNPLGRVFLDELIARDIKTNNIVMQPTKDMREVFPIGADKLIEKIVGREDAESVIDYLESQGIKCHDKFGNVLSLSQVFINIAKKDFPSVPPEGTGDIPNDIGTTPNPDVNVNTNN